MTASRSILGGQRRRYASHSQTSLGHNFFYLESFSGLRRVALLRDWKTRQIDDYFA